MNDNSSNSCWETPVLDNRVIFIADNKSVQFSCVASSYFPEGKSYVPFFSFPNVAVGYSEKFDFNDDNYISMTLGNESATLINNAIARFGCEYIVFLGLSSYQKTYLNKYFNNKGKIKIIEIDRIEDIEEKLAGIGMSKEQSIPCRKKDLLKGLIQAKIENKALILDESAEEIRLHDIESDGIVVIEDSNELGSILGVNYAFSVGANCKIVNAISEEESLSILRFIQKWQYGNASNQLQKVLNKAERRIGTIDFSNYKYATFFTTGLPYSLYLKNYLPCSYVNLKLRPDLFLINNIAFENIDRFNSAVVFSPQFFEDEETGNLIALFKEKNLHTKVLIGRNATVGSFDFYVPHYPYSILHICSHGGEVDGYNVVEEFTDRYGKKHVIEYDEVVGFSPVPDTDKIAVHRKTIFKKLDGFLWKSSQLSKQKYPKEVYEDMRKALYHKEEPNKKAKREYKERISTSCAVACSDSIHQGMFQILASHSSPFIFNNTCWSWNDVSSFFLSGGASGYIGTLWKIGNRTSVIGANTFYSNAFDKPIIIALHDALSAITNPKYKDIYVFWGLHFSTLRKGIDADNSKYRVFRELVRSFFAWGEKVTSTKIEEVRRNSIEIVKNIHQEIITNFGKDEAIKLEQEIDENMKKILGEEIELERSISVKEIHEDSLELPIKYVNNDKKC